MRRWRCSLRRETIVLSRPDDGSEGELHRWRLIETPLGGIMLHQHHGPDPGRVLHDHPWPFASLILRGGYVEEIEETRSAPYRAMQVRRHLKSTYGAPTRRRAGSIHVIGLHESHRIVELDRSPTWTLVIHGRRRRRWGFYPEHGWMDEKHVDWAHIDLIGANARSISLDSGDET